LGTVLAIFYRNYGFEMPTWFIVCFFIGFIAFGAIIVRLMFISDQIVRFICQKEGRAYPRKWMFGLSSTYWQMRSLPFPFVPVVREAGYLKEVSLLNIAAFMIIVTLAFLMLNFTGPSSSHP